MSVRVFPRRKAGEECSSPEKGRLPLKFDVETIQPLFALPQKDAANVLGISLTALKKVCRKLGIHSWAQVRDVRIPLQASIYAQKSAHMSSAPAVLEHGANFGTSIAPMRRRGAPRSPRGRDSNALNRKTTCIPTFWPEANKNAVPDRDCASLDEFLDALHFEEMGSPIPEDTHNDDGGDAYADWIVAGSIGNTVASTCTYAQTEYGSSVMYQCRDDLAYLVPEPMPLGRVVDERDTACANEWLQWYDKSSRSLEAILVNQGDFEM